MVQVIKGGPSRSAMISDILGPSIGEGVGNFLGDYFATKSLNALKGDSSLKDAPLSEKMSRLEAALRPHGQRGMKMLQSQITFEQQAAQEKQEKQNLARTKAENKYINGENLTPQEDALVRPELKVSFLKAKQPKGGLTGQSVPTKIAQKIPQILNANKNANADELAVAMDEAEIPRAYSNSYIENRRRSDERVEDRDFKIHQDSAKADKIIQDEAKVAKKQIEATQDILDSISEGKIKPLSLSNLFSGMGKIGDKLASAFKSAYQGKFEAALPILIEGWKDVFGVRLSDADLKIIENKLPSIGKDPEANKAIVDIIRKYAKNKIDRGEIAREIKKENNGLRPLNFADKVEERLEQKQLQESGKIKVRNKKTGKTGKITPSQGWENDFEPI